MASLQAAAQAVGAPVPPVAVAARDAAVSRAIRQARATPDPFPAHRDRPRPLRRWAPWVAAASAAAAAAVAIPVVISRSSSPPLSASRALKSPTSASPPVVDGGDLGSLSDQVALRDTVRHQLDAAAGAGTPAQVAAPNQGGPAAVPSASASAASPAGPGGAATAAASPGAGANPSPASSSQCRGAAQQYGGAGLGTLVYAAGVRWQDAPAEVLVFRVSGGSLPYRLFVMARDGCQLLVVQSF
jgi:hypothetical protein